MPQDLAPSLLVNLHTRTWISHTSARPERIAAAADELARGLSFGTSGNAVLEPGDMTYYGVVVARLSPEQMARSGATHVVAIGNLGFVANVHLGDPTTGLCIIRPSDLNGLAGGSMIVIAALLTELSARLHP